MLERIKCGEDALQSLRVLVVGDAAVGKTSLVEAICNGGVGGRCPEEELRGDKGEWTCGCALSITREIVEVGMGMRPAEVEVELWEVGGTQTYAAARPVFYEDFDALLLVYDVSNTKSYENLAVWLFELCTSIRLPSLRYWDRGGGSGGEPDADPERGASGHSLQQLILSGRCPVLFVAHKCDLRPPSERRCPLQRPKPPERAPMLDRLLGGGDGVPAATRRSAADDLLLEQLCDLVRAGRHTEATSKGKQTFDFVLWRDFIRRTAESRKKRGLDHDGPGRPAGRSL